MCRERSEGEGKEVNKPLLKVSCEGREPRGGNSVSFIFSGEDLQDDACVLARKFIGSLPQIHRTISIFLPELEKLGCQSKRNSHVVQRFRIPFRELQQQRRQFLPRSECLVKQLISLSDVKIFCLR